jgi:intraflagellar transport protein 172
LTDLGWIGELKEKDGDIPAAIELYLRANYPSKAANLIIAEQYFRDKSILDVVASALLKKADFEKAGEFFEAWGNNERALDAYRRAHAYRKAVDLCRRFFPGYVVKLEEGNPGFFVFVLSLVLAHVMCLVNWVDWGDWLVSQKQMDAACTHYTECGAYLKAVNAAIEAKQWNRLKILVCHTQRRKPLGCFFANTFCFVA